MIDRKVGFGLWVDNHTVHSLILFEFLFLRLLLSFFFSVFFMKSRVSSK